MSVSLFNCWMDIWYVLKKQGFTYGNSHLKQLMTEKYPDSRVLKKLARQA